jgi:hypothetical protein
MSYILGVIAGLLQSVLSLFGFVHSSPTLPPALQVQTTQVIQQTATQPLTIVYPTAGIILPIDKKTTVQWAIPDSVLQSFPKDFDLYIFLRVEGSEDSKGVIPSDGIGDGYDPSLRAVTWDIPAHIAAGQLKPGMYKVVAYLQAEPKDKNRLCARAIAKDCLPSEADQAVMQRSVNIKAESGWFTIGSATNVAQSVSVPGMSKYTDSDFGFSFWYPSGWTVSDVPIPKDGNDWPQSLYGPVRKIKLLQVSNGIKTIDVAEATSSTGIYAGGCGTCWETIYFDSSSGQWMDHDQNRTDGGRQDKLYPADLSKKTMGGLPIFWGEVVALSSTKFVGVVGLYTNYGLLTNTIVATDASAATPVNAAQQMAIIQAEQQAYAGQ